MNPYQDVQPVIGLHLRANGTVRPLTSRADIDDAIGDLDSVPGTAAARGWDADGYRLVMLVDDIGLQRNLPLNLAATDLYGTGWPIVGDAILIDDSLRPLPADLVNRHLLDAGPLVADRSPTVDDAVALEVEDYLDYLDRDHYQDPDDADLEPEPGDDWLRGEPRSLDDVTDLSW